MVAGKVETQLVEGEFYPKAYPTPTDDNASFNAPNAYKLLAVLDLDGDGKTEIVVGSNYTKERLSRFIAATRRRLKLYFLLLAAPDRFGSCSSNNTEVRLRSR